MVRWDPIGGIEDACRRREGSTGALAIPTAIPNGGEMNERRFCKELHYCTLAVAIQTFHVFSVIHNYR